jgi:hypothetical protein
MLRIAASRGPLRSSVDKRCNPYCSGGRRDHLNSLFHWHAGVTSSRDPGLRIRGHSVERLPPFHAELPLVGCRLSVGVCYQTLGIIATTNGVLDIAASMVAQVKYAHDPPLARVCDRRTPSRLFPTNLVLREHRHHGRLPRQLHQPSYG